MPSDHASRVAILLATYQGGEFLAEQLASLRHQTHQQWHLFWRDDGSVDDTCAIVERCVPARQQSRVGFDGGRLGVVGSFMELLHRADGDYDFYAFCDQDDVWLPDKLERAVVALAESAAPALYCARQQLVDRDLRPIGLSPAPRRPLGFQNALVQNIATGCTMVLNRAARDAILSAPRPPAASFHDWWCYIVVSGAGGAIIFDRAPAVLYRQHRGNVVGAANPWQRAGRAVRRGAGPFLRQLGDHLALLGEDLQLTPENAGVVRMLAGLRDASVWRRWRALRRAGLYRQSIAEDMLMMLWIGLGRVP